jgi:hypothetical protein
MESISHLAAFTYIHLSRRPLCPSFCHEMRYDCHETPRHAYLPPHSTLHPPRSTSLPPNQLLSPWLPTHTWQPAGRSAHVNESHLSANEWAKSERNDRSHYAPVACVAFDSPTLHAHAPRFTLHPLGGATWVAGTARAGEFRANSPRSTLRLHPSPSTLHAPPSTLHQPRGMTVFVNPPRVMRSRFRRARRTGIKQSAP